MSNWAAALRLLGIGWYIAFCLVLGLAAGRWLDSQFGTTFLTLTCFFLGLVAAFVGLYRMVFPLSTKDTGNENEKEDN